MAFSSLADELADVFDQGYAGGGRSLADEFGLDGEIDDTTREPGSRDIDDLADSLDTSPQPHNPLTPHLEPTTPPTPTSYSRISKANSTQLSGLYEQDSVDDLFLDPITLFPGRDLPVSPRYKGRGPKPQPHGTQGNPVGIARDPIVELEECKAATRGLIVGLKGIQPSSSRMLIASASSRTITPASYAHISEERDLIDQLETYLARLQDREKRLVERIRDLEAIAERWEMVDWGGSSQIDLSGLIRDIAPIPEEPYEGLPSSSSMPISSLHSDTFLSPSISDLDNPFSPAPRLQLNADSSLPAHLLELLQDPLLPSLTHLRETLHTHSSHHLATQRRIRHIKVALAGAKDRDEAEEAAKRGIEVWEAGRMAERLRGVSVGDRLEVERKGLEMALEVYEREMEVRMRMVRGILAG